MRLERQYRDNSKSDEETMLMDLEAPDSSATQSKIKDALRRDEKEQRTAHQYMSKLIRDICSC